MSLGSAQNCPCGSGEKYNTCCAKLILAGGNAASPEQLMRSRFTAYTLKNEDYLLKTWQRSSRPRVLDLENDKTRWKKLVVLYNSQKEVHFIAFFASDINNTEQLFSLYEESEFIKENDVWFYLSGKALKTIALSKNMACPCGSGKKFKRCCEKDLKN